MNPRNPEPVEDVDADRIDDLTSNTPLSERQAYVFVLAFERGHPEAITADFLGVETGTVRSHKARVRRKVRESRRLSEVADGVVS